MIDVPIEFKFDGDTTAAIEEANHNCIQVAGDISNKKLVQRGTYGFREPSKVGKPYISSLHVIFSSFRSVQYEINVVFSQAITLASHAC